MSSRNAERASQAASTFVYVAGGAAIGLLAGGFIGSVFADGMGVDRLADVLGGAGIGVMFGAVLTLGSARRLAAARRARVGVVMLIVAAMVFALARSRAESNAAEASPSEVTGPANGSQRPVTTPR